MAPAELGALRVSLRSFLGLEGVEVEIGRTVLYGPNATGKSLSILSIRF